MIRLGSVLATFLLLAIQVCIALGTSPYKVELSIESRRLGLESFALGSRAVLDRIIPATWVLEPSGAIKHLHSGFYLGYELEAENAPLLLTKNPVRWKITRVQKGIEISIWYKDLVFGMLPSSDNKPRVGLTRRNKGPHTWKVRFFDIIAPYIAEGNYELVLRDNLYLGLTDETPFSPVRLLDASSPTTVWTVTNDGRPGLVVIQNLKTGHYLSYTPQSLGEPMKITHEKSAFHISQADGNPVQIITGNPNVPPRAVAEMPTTYGPPMVGLADIRKDPGQLWSLVPARELDDSPQQYRLPFRRLHF
ncbi:hypothetical protein DFQ26_000143, partial [Actinomortierella ambigua]